MSDAFDEWRDNSEHNLLWASIGDDCWRGIAYDMAEAAYEAGAAQAAAAERERCAQLAEQHQAIYYRREPCYCNDFKPHGKHSHFPSRFADLLRQDVGPE